MNKYYVEFNNNIEKNWNIPQIAQIRSTIINKDTRTVTQHVDDLLGYINATGKETQCVVIHLDDINFYKFENVNTKCSYNLYYIRQIWKEECEL